MSKNWDELTFGFNFAFKKGDEVFKYQYNRVVGHKPGDEIPGKKKVAPNKGHLLKYMMSY